MFSYNNKSYIVSKRYETTCDLLPIVIKDNKSYTVYREAPVMGVPLKDCKFETLETFIAKGNYFKDKTEFLKTEKKIETDKKVEKPKKETKKK